MKNFDVNEKLLSLESEIESLKEELKKKPKIPARRGRPKAEA